VSVLTPEDYNTIHQFCSSHKQFTRLSHLQQTQFIQQAVETGNQVARTIKQDYNDIPLYELINRLAIKIEYDHQHQQIGNMVIRAKYTGNPSTITIYRKVIQQLAESNKLKFSLERLEEIAVAHELYHHLTTAQIRNPKSEIRNKEMKQKIPRLFDELAAHSFTRHFLGLDFFPLSLDARTDFI
jgi:hypothetical protein